MYLQQCFLVSICGFIWFCLDYGQVMICVLFSLNFFIGSVECRTQTDELAEHPPCQETNEEIHSGHRSVPSERCKRLQESSTTSFPEELQHGFQYLTVKRSLREVFECAYTQSVLPWYTVPESTINQPLHAVLQTEFDLFVDRLICRAKEFDLRDASIGCIGILTQHLRNAKQNRKLCRSAPLFNSRTEEMAILRMFSEALVRNLFPETILGLQLNCCILNEVVAVKVLDLLVTWLSDPDYLNQLVVSQLGSCGEEEEEESLWSRLRERTCSAGLKTSKQGRMKFFGKTKTEKAKRKELKMKEQELDWESGGGGLDVVDGIDEVDGVICQEDDSDPESYLTSVQEDMMEFKLSYEMWKMGNWTVVVNKVEQNEDLCFTVHLEERDNPDILHWDILKTDTDLLHFHSSGDMSGLPSISAILADRGQDRDAAFLEEAKTILQNFLQELVADEHFGHSQPVFQFLCPLDRLLNEEEPGSGVWGLLSGIAYFLTPGQEEEEHNGPGADTQSVNDMKITAATVHEPEATHQSSKVNGQDQHAKGDILEPHHPASLNGFSSSESNSRRCSENSKYGSKTNIEGCTKEPVLTNGNEPEESEDVPDSARPNAKEQLEATKAIFDLLKEISGNSLILNILFDAILKPVMPWVKKKVNSFIDQMIPTEEQMASYIDLVREKQWPNGTAPADGPKPRTPEDMKNTRERAQQLINTKYSNCKVLKRLIPKTEVETVFKIFQDTEENKKLVYMILSFLLHQFLPGEPAILAKHRWISNTC
ncbi:uncharacterized protein LOC134439804 [Engraulis encrasicolus]|uniref:uncharacterized protein LOC134439804 n=1 Tax=Engraulis encrasicolus TaxID=184585 RepID=UPI002FD1378E